MKKNIQNAFSLMEMMVVLLIVAIIAAATAPMVTKKMARTAGSGDSPWVFTGLNNNIAYNMGGNDNVTAIIGATSLPSGWNQHTRLFIDSGNNASHIAFGNGNATPMGLTVDPNGRVGFSDADIPSSSVAFGTGQKLSGTGVVAVGINSEASNNNSIAIGSSAKVTAGDSIALGYGARNNGSVSVAIGPNAGYDIANHIVSTGTASISIGSGANAGGEDAIAYGRLAKASGTEAIAIGIGATATAKNSIAIGSRTKVPADNQIVLGTTDDIVYIPGRLVVGKTAVLGYSNGAVKDSSSVAVIRSNRDGQMEILQRDGDGDWDAVLAKGRVDYSWAELTKYTTSDRRLKNVGEKYTAGLDELKKLDFYHYTFKADKDNTPLVGVMAQDLQKVFPDAVTKGDDGYLRIRLEDMFYAVINAVKELDAKVSEIVTNITDIKATIQSQQDTIDGLKKQNSELQKQNEELQEEIKNIEKRIKKLER